jgi:hypothetical protein
MFITSGTGIVYSSGVKQFTLLLIGRVASIFSFLCGVL